MALSLTNQAPPPHPYDRIHSAFSTIPPPPPPPPTATPRRSSPIQHHLGSTINNRTNYNYNSNSNYCSNNTTTTTASNTKINTKVISSNSINSSSYQSQSPLGSPSAVASPRGPFKTASSTSKDALAILQGLTTPAALLFDPRFTSRLRPSPKIPFRTYPPSPSSQRLPHSLPSTISIQNLDPGESAEVMDKRHPQSFQQLEKLGEGTYATVCGWIMKSACIHGFC